MNNITTQELLASLPYNEKELAKRLRCDKSTIYRWQRGESTPRASQLERLKELRGLPPRRTPRNPKFAFIDLFAGIGGMRLGLEAAGGQCVYSSEMDKFARETYKKNFSDSVWHLDPRDINQVDPNEIPDHDLLAAGFPCQPFSVAGVSKKNALGMPHGFADEDQGNLFFRIRDILLAKQPPAFLLENVKNLVSHDKGNTFRVIKDVLETQLGYQLQHRIINAKGWLPQNRERIFLVGFRQPTRFDFESMIVKNPLKGPTLGEKVLEPKAKVDKKYILTKHLWKYLRDYAAKHRALGHGFGYGLVTEEGVARTLSARYYKDGSEILVKRGKGRPRRLTPVECARLMGFPADFKIPVSDTQAYKQFGNAVAVPVVKKIAKEMRPHLLPLINTPQFQFEFSDAGTPDD